MIVVYIEQNLERIKKIYLFQIMILLGENKRRD